MPSRSGKNVLEITAVTCTYLSIFKTIVHFQLVNIMMCDFCFSNAVEKNI